MSTPRVSVVVPTYRRGTLLAETLASVAQQTFQDFECLVIEDGSDDETAKVMRDLSLRDPRFSHIALAHSGKPGRTRNAGIQRARAELCAFLDDDDLWLPHKLATQVAVLDAEPGLGLVCSRIEEFGARSGLWPAGSVPREIDFSLLLVGNFVATSTVVARRQLLLDIDGFDAELPRAQDYDLWLRIAHRHRIAFVDEVLCRYRTHAGNISADRQKSLDCIERILRRFHAQGSVTDAQLQQRMAGIYRQRAELEPLVTRRLKLRAQGLWAALQGHIPVRRA